MRVVLLLAVLCLAFAAKRPTLEPLQPQFQPKAELAVTSDEAVDTLRFAEVHEQEYQGGSEYQGDIPSDPASDEHTASPDASAASSLAVEFTFSLDYNTLTANPDDLKNFKAQLAEDVATALGVETSSVSVSSVAPGSVKATIEIAESSGKSLEDLAVQTRALYEDTESALYKGVVTSNIDNSVPLKFVKGSSLTDNAAPRAGASAAVLAAGLLATILAVAL